jgi:hypothetical protein
VAGWRDFSYSTNIKVREDIMKTLLTLIAVATLAGCATYQPAPANYATRYSAPADPSQWHTVSVTPVAPGTGERVAATSGTGSAVQYSSEPIVQQTYVAPPLYAAQPVYVPQPVYYAPAPYYYPPVSIGLDFMFGRSWGGHRGGRNWAGVGIGSRWHR